MAGKFVFKKKAAAVKAAPVAAKKKTLKAAPKPKKAKAAVVRVNFDMDPEAYGAAAEGCKKFEKTISAAGRLFLQCVGLAANGSQKQEAQAARAILSLASPEGSRVPKDPKAAKAPVKKSLKPKAAPAKVAAPKAAPVAVKRALAPAVSNGAVAAVRPPIPLKFVLKRPLASA